ncbi:MAG: SusC/RagA family TonB-linked outer membrane protein [Sphingobacteriales bacterium]|nr:SusC/RagA family TonB-linked outer membrane protein [Sphingobacteriales bacterium]OJW00223.1 MAG: hypothetical protein BGO52_03820 [Sphingobacteriales bacterium 44-61]
MKLLTVFVTIFCLHVSAKTGAQQVTLNLANVTLEKVFEEIQKQTSYNFFFQEDALAKANKVTVKVKNATVKSVLDFCFKDQPFTFEILDKSIVVKQKEETPIPKSKIPPITITGKVVNEKGEPIAGASIRVKGSTIGTSTDNNGEFSLSKIDGPITLIISGTETQPQEIVISESGPVTIQLTTKVKEFDQVLFVAYGTTTKRLSTGNVTTVKASEIGKQPVNNPLLALQGYVPGLFITQNSGISGGGVTVRVQGQNSIQSGNDPLYVIDGVPIIPQLTGTELAVNIFGNSGKIAAGSKSAEGNPLNYLDPSNIESITVLKDADATAIYGSRAANGAILVTTKKGKIGKTTVNIDIKKGLAQVPRKLKMLGSRQYLDMRYEAFQNDGLDWTSPFVSANDLKLWDTTRYTDWQETLIGKTAQILGASANISGGTPNIQYLVGATFNQQTTVFPLPSEFADKKGAVNFNLKSTSTDKKFEFLFSGNYVIDFNRLPATDLTASAIQTEPIAPPLYNDDGSLNWQLTSSGVPTFINPLAFRYEKYENTTKNLIANLSVNYELMPGLEIGSTFGYNNMVTGDFLARPLSAIRPNWRNTVQKNTAFYGNRNINSWIIEPQLNYKKALSFGTIQFLAGGTFNQVFTGGATIVGTGYTSEGNLKDPKAASSLTATNSFNTQYKYSALFGRINYNYRDKYLLNLTARRDGSSRFGSANRLHNFGAIGVGWIFSSEDFITRQLKPLSFGKIRASYGTTGNDQITDYGYLALFQPTENVDIPYQGISTTFPSSPPNPNLQWERTNKFQVGLDLGFINDRILLGITYSDNRSSNQLLPYSMPTVTGFSSIPVVNFPATIQNTSLEISLNTTIIKRKSLSWSINSNFTLPKNKVKEFPGIESSTYAQILVIGQPVNVLKTFHYQGVDPQTGLYSFLSKNDPLKPDRQEDANTFISTFPKYYGGLASTLTFKGIQFDFLLQFVKQVGQNFKYFNGSSTLPGVFFRGYSNQPETILNRWHNQGDNDALTGKLGTYSFGERIDNIYSLLQSDAVYTDASFIRLKNVAISWNLPHKWVEKIKSSNIQVYVQGQNLLTFTSYQGLDPETQTTFLLPPLRILTTGIRFQF